MNTRSLSFRIKMATSKSRETVQEIISYATPLRSNLTRRGSVEVISDVELTAVEGINGDFAFKRKKSIKSRRYANRSLTTIAFISNTHSSTDSTEEHFIKVEWRRVHIVVADGVVAYSDPNTFLLESRLSLTSAKIREVRHKGRGVLKVALNDNTTFYIRFRDREERRQWLNCLHEQTSFRPKGMKRPPPPIFESVYPVSVSPVSTRSSCSSVFSQPDKKKSKRRLSITFVSTALAKIHQKTHNAVKKRISIA